MSDTTPIPPASERERFEAWFSENGRWPASIERRGDFYILAAASSAWDTWQARAALSHPSTPQGWQPIETAPEGELVVVGWLDGEDTDHPERHDFDWLEEGVWQKHSENHEFFLMVAPPGSRGPSENAPYTHWQRVGAIPTPPEQGGKG